MKIEIMRRRRTQCHLQMLEDQLFVVLHRIVCFTHYPLGALQEIVDVDPRM